MRTDYLLFLFLLVLLAFVVGLPSLRLYLRAIYRLLTGRGRRTVARRATVIDAAGAEYALPGDSVTVETAWQSRLDGALRTLNRDGGLRARILTATIAIGTLLLLPRLLSGTRADDFTVFVAPFQQADGSVTQTGRALAAQLAAELPQQSGGRVVAQALSEPPADAAAALALIEEQGADVLIWGEVTAGGLLDEASITPQIVYRPSGGFAPNSLEGYAGRFAMPAYYPLSTAPINGAAALPPLLGALADYGAGRFDAAYTTLGRLLDDTPGLAEALPRSVRGTIQWARADYVAAATEYRSAIGNPAAPSIPEAGLLQNNLGAVLHDADDQAARSALNDAIAMLAGRDLGELRYNLALEALRAGDTARAISELTVARSLLPPSAALELTAAEALRESGNLGDADNALEVAFRRVAADDITTIDSLRNVSTERLRARWLYQDALLGLARQVGARGPLLWELEADPALSAEELALIRSDLEQAINTTSELIRNWNRQATAADAADAPLTGRVAAAQALHAEELLRDARRWHAIVEIAILRIQGPQRPQGIAAIWAALSGQRTPSAVARSDLEQILRDRPGDVDATLALARLFHLNGDREEARARYMVADSAAPHRPEPLYGQARIALESGDRAQARTLLEATLAREPRFFPAHLQLAALAKQDGDWPTAIREHEWLAENRRSFANTMALAEVLRLSGPDGYPRAEALLLEPANGGNVDALIALSQLYRASGDIAGAREMLQRAQEATARTSARFADVAYALGQLLEAEGLTGQARGEYQRALSVNPEHIPSLLALAQSETEPAAAAEYYRTALNAGESDLQVLKQIGATLLALRAYEPALTAFERATTVPPGGDDPENHYGMALAYLRLNRIDQAQREALRAVALRGGSYPEAMIVLGDAALARNAVPDAVQQYNNALQLNDALPGAHIGLGRAEAAEERWAVAAGHFRNAIARDPELADGYVWLGEALLQQGDARAAQTAFQQALALRSDDAEIYYGLARAEFALQRLAEARTLTNSAIELRPEYAEALLLRGKIDETQERDDQALEHYRQAIEARRPQTPALIIAEAHYRRGLILIRSNRLDEARRDLEEAARLQPNFSEASYWLGRVYFAQDNMRDARERFRRAVALRGGSYAEAQYYQGMAEEQAGMRSEAITSFRAAMEQGRDTIWATEARAALTRMGEP
jgi:tetratricopeptide (TPR) repeat protein